MSLKRILNELHNIIPNKLLENNIFDKFLINNFLFTTTSCAS